MLISLIIQHLLWELWHYKDIETPLYMPKGNRNPVQSTQFKEKQFQAYGEVGSIPLSKKAISIKLPQDVHDVLENLPSEERVTYLRRIISEGVRRDLME